MYLASILLFFSFVGSLEAIPYCSLVFFNKTPEAAKTFELEQHFKEVHAAHKGDPLARAQELVDLMAATGFKDKKLVSINKKGQPSYKGDRLKRFHAISDAELDTVFVVPTNFEQRTQKDGVIYLHGLGLDYSNMGSTYGLIDTILSVGNAAMEKKGNSYGKHLATKLSPEVLDYLKTLVPMTADLPGTGTGADPQQFKSLKDVTNYYRAVLNKARSFLPPGAKLHVVARSASSPLLVEALSQKMEGIGEVILTGATHPHNDIALPVMKQIFKGIIAERGLANLFGLRWFLERAGEFSFHKNKTLLKKILEENSVHNFVGVHDTQVSPQSRKVYEAWNELGMRYNLRDAGHDVFALPRDSSHFAETEALHIELLEILAK
jgi:hypothetical protein